MNAWLVAAAALLAGMLPLGWVAARHAAEDGLVALEAGGTTLALVLLLVAQGTDRSAVSDLALVMAAVSLVGSLALATLLEREP
jgi:multisubunit Na+/H+ antiporter MnhF subunit